MVSWILRFHFWSDNASLGVVQTTYKICINSLVFLLEYSKHSRVWHLVNSFTCILACICYSGHLLADVCSDLVFVVFVGHSSWGGAKQGASRESILPCFCSCGCFPSHGCWCVFVGVFVVSDNYYSGTSQDSSLSDVHPASISCLRSLVSTFYQLYLHSQQLSIIHLSAHCQSALLTSNICKICELLFIF